jgi:hypothetical protein
MKLKLNNYIIYILSHAKNNTDICIVNNKVRVPFQTLLSLPQFFSTSGRNPNQVCGGSDVESRVAYVENSIIMKKSGFVLDLTSKIKI